MIAVAVAGVATGGAGAGTVTGGVATGGEVGGVEEGVVPGDAGLGVVLTGPPDIGLPSVQEFSSLEQ